MKEMENGNKKETTRNRNMKGVKKNKDNNNETEK